ncbi:hypothetical protein [Maricaulis sp. CAU 1757]
MRVVCALIASVLLFAGTAEAQSMTRPPAAQQRVQLPAQVQVQIPDQLLQPIPGLTREAPQAYDCTIYFIHVAIGGIGFTCWDRVEGVRYLMTFADGGRPGGADTALELLLHFHHAGQALPVRHIAARDAALCQQIGAYSPHPPHPALDCRSVVSMGGLIPRQR